MKKLNKYIKETINYLIRKQKRILEDWDNQIEQKLNYSLLSMEFNKWFRNTYQSTYRMNFWKVENLRNQIVEYVLKKN